MAETPTDTRKIRRAAANDAEDSVEAEFGGDYSEGSLELIRSLSRKGAQFGEVEPWEEQAVQPPAQEKCDAAVEQLSLLDRSLEQIKQYVPNAKELAWIDYKRALVEDASDREITWLKLKAYHHGLGALRASSHVSAAAGDVHDAREREAFLSQEPEPSAHSGEVLAARAAVRNAVRALLPSSSGEEEDLNGATAPAAPRWGSHEQAGSSSSGVSGAAATSTAPSAAAAATTAPGGTVYQPEYLEELRLKRQLAQQQQQRNSAFLLGLLAAVGVSVVRWWVRRTRAGNGGGAARRAMLQQPQLLPQ